LGFNDRFAGRKARIDALDFLGDCPAMTACSDPDRRARIADAKKAAQRVLRGQFWVETKAAPAGARLVTCRR